MFLNGFYFLSRSMNNQLTKHTAWIYLLLTTLILGSNCYHVDLFDDGPIVKGATITFTAIVYHEDNIATGDFKYFWKDNGIPGHIDNKTSKSGIDTWTVEYDKKMYPQGPYVAQVTVCKYYLNIYCYDIASNRIFFNINETLNGGINLIQNNRSLTNLFVSNATPVVHNVSLKRTDMDFLKKAPTVLTYWFVDCTYYGFRNDFTFPFNYTQSDVDHVIEALVVADFTPLPIPTTTTTTTTTSKPTTITTTTSKPTTSTTSKPTTTTLKPTTTTTTLKPTITTTKTSTTTKGTTTVAPESTTLAPKSIVKRGVSTQNETSQIWVNVNGTLVVYNGSFPYVCNGTTIATDPKKTYGYFFKKVHVREPISKVNVTGNNWLQHGDVLTLNVKCQASKNIKYCVLYQTGAYNVTGNETCPTYHEIDKCEFPIQRYLMESTEHTIIIIIENEVSREVKLVTVTVYKVKKQAQLSVIVVPVAFSLAAVVLVVFGVAYYIQNRSRFVVEVADFDFGQNYSDMEYKTFKERLRDSIANALFTRPPSPGSSEVPVWPPGRKYGSMTS